MSEALSWLGHTVNPKSYIPGFMDGEEDSEQPALIVDNRGISGPLCLRRPSLAPEATFFNVVNFGTPDAINVWGVSLCIGYLHYSRALQFTGAQTIED